jgi:signal transduction histidine kinase
MDGFIRARQTNEKVDFDQDIRQGAFWKDNLQTGRPYGTLANVVTNEIDRIERINSYRVLPEYPLVVTIGKSNQVVLASFEQRKKGYIHNAWLGSLFIAVIGLFLVKKHKTTNVTERKKYEAELSRLDNLNLIGEMAAGIGHEVRNPMTTVRGYLQWFNQKEAFAEHRESFTIMINELDRANSIITDFLSLAKDKKVELVLTDLNKIILSAFPLLQADAFLRGNEIELELLGTFEIFMDDREIRQCILNLVGNALDSMPNGGVVTISTANVGNQVVMTVRDQGQGMTSEVKAKLWTPFFTTKEKGTGLGLPLCFQIAQRHEATIEVETGVAGTAFHFVFNQKKIK